MVRGQRTAIKFQGELTAFGTDDKGHRGSYEGSSCDRNRHNTKICHLPVLSGTVLLDWQRMTRRGGWTERSQCMNHLLSSIVIALRVYSPIINTMIACFSTCCWCLQQKIDIGCCKGEKSLCDHVLRVYLLHRGSGDNCCRQDAKSLEESPLHCT